MPAKKKSKSAKPARKTTAKKTAKKAARPAARKANVGAVAHTEFVSADPIATKDWAKKTFGWKFPPAMPTPGGDYHMWQAKDDSGGGIRTPMGPEAPGTIVYVEIADVKRGFDKAVKAGATVMLPPQPIGEGMGSMAIVLAPGGVPVGLWSPK